MIAGYLPTALFLHKAIDASGRTQVSLDALLSQEAPIGPGAFLPFNFLLFAAGRGSKR